MPNSFASEANSDPAVRLTAEILDASVICALQFQAGTALNAPETHDIASTTFALAAEFAAAFTCLALKLVLIVEHRDALRSKLLFLLPDEVKGKIIEREDEYVACAEVMVVDKPLTGAGVVNRLALHLASLLGSPFTPEVFRQSAVVFADISGKLNLRELVSACVA